MQEPGFVSPSLVFYIDEHNEEAMEWAKALGLDTEEVYYCRFSPIPIKIWAEAFDIPYPHIIFLANGTSVDEGDRIRPEGWSAGDDEYQVRLVEEWKPSHVRCRLVKVEGHGG